MRAQLIMLGIAFLLGMAVNLIGLPSQTSGLSQTWTSIFVAFHVLIAVGLLAGGSIAIGMLRKYEPTQAKLGWAGLAAIAITFIAGVLTIAYENNWWSYLMAVGFFASIWIYGILYFRVAER